MKAFVVSLIILLIGFTGVLNPAKDIFHILTSPLQLGLRELGNNTRNGFVFFSDLRKIRQENLTLLEEVESLNSKLLEIKWAVEENKVLKEQLELKDSNVFDRNLLLANVLGNIAEISGESVVLDKGSRQGIEPGNNVIRGNFLIGVVREVSLERSIVYLISSPTVSATVMDIDVPGNTEGLVRGQFGTSIEMSRILPDEEIFVGDTIVTSGKDGLFEPGLIIGEVSKIEQQPAQPLKSAYIDTRIDINNLNRVFVILDN